MEIIKLKKVKTLVLENQNSESCIFLLDFKIGNVKFTGLIDTGCTVSIFSFLDKTVPLKKSHFEAGINRVTGEEKREQIFLLSGIRIGKKTKIINNVEIISNCEVIENANLSINNSVDEKVEINCIIGNDILLKLNAIIDLSKETLIVK